MYPRNRHHLRFSEAFFSGAVVTGSIAIATLNTPMLLASLGGLLISTGCAGYEAAEDEAGLVKRPHVISKTKLAGYICLGLISTLGAGYIKYTDCLDIEDNACHTVTNLFIAGGTLLTEFGLFKVMESSLSQREVQSVRATSLTAQ